MTREQRPAEGMASAKAQRQERALSTGAVRLGTGMRVGGAYAGGLVGLGRSVSSNLGAFGGTCKFEARHWSDLVALLKELSDKGAEVGSGRQELGCREMIGVAVAVVQV